MALVKIRQGMVYTLTGIFFVVAAMAQLEGDTVTDAFGKAGIACVVLTGMSWAIIRILDDAARKLATGQDGQGALEAGGPQPAPAAPNGSEQIGRG